ncbi:MAG: GGDEF domain-containing protein [Xanthomonadaceae bacterium]|nr:GGDEF domain-containing protein [Xanthomonadaceae bacterium]MDP2183932.1 GGDEF domain-containing protein [Xanthomonadales bacterium]MDZ4116499.1 GGDEF domain-containing protein [Xanthomonadaceae bacterium]
MIDIDLRSVMMVSVLLGILFSIGLLAARSYTDGRTRDSMTIWALGMLLQPITWGLIVLRGQIPDYLSIAVANSLTAITFALFAHALRRLRQPSGVPKLPYSLAVLVFVGMSVEMFFIHDAHWRVIVVATLVTWQLLLVGREALAGQWRLQQAGEQLTAAVFFLGAGIMAARGVHEVIFAVGLTPAFVATPMQIALYMYMALGSVIASFGYVLICNERTFAELRQMAATDPLTGLFNRRPFEQMGEKLIADAARKRRPLALLIIDVDHFKQFNDSYGHAVGDAVLQRLADVLQAQLRSADLIGRMGGEEFAALLPDTGLEPARQVAERLREAVDALEVSSVGVVVRIQISIGLAMLDEKAAHSDEPAEMLVGLMREADLAMYAAKRAGRNRVEVAL